MGIVRGKLRIQIGTSIQHDPRAGQKRNIGITFTREYGIFRQSLFLRGLYFRIPIGALDQSDRDDLAGLAGNLFQPAQHLHGALLV